MSHAARQLPSWLTYNVSQSVNAVLILPYAVAVLALATLLIAIWSRGWPRTKGTIEVSIFDREWAAESSDSSVTVERKGKFYLAYLSLSSIGRFPVFRV
jgi:hypothetical protein